MANINLTDSRKRDAVVKAESISPRSRIRYIGPKGGASYTRKVLKSTVDHDYDTLLEQAGDDPEKLAKMLIESDIEVDKEVFGRFLWNVSRVYINKDEEVTYRIQQNEIIYTPAGKFKERRQRERAEANVDSEIPLNWTGKKVDKNEAIRRYVFSSKLQIIHINGLTYDFLYGMAKELAELNSLLLLGGGKGGKSPLVFRRGSTPYRGFLEGRVKDDSYVLLLHLSNAELKSPAEVKAPAKAKDPVKTKTQPKAKTSAKTKAPAKAKTQAKAKTSAKTKAPAKAKIQAKAKTSAKTKSPAKAKTQAKAKKAVKTKTPAKTKVPPKAKVKAKAPAKTKTPAKASPKKKKKTSK
jgi:chemotaxis protein histidine kinase CheA